MSTLSTLPFILLIVFMGQVMRAMSYDRAANEANAVTALRSMQWYRLDDGVMGGQSETILLNTIDNNDNNSNDNILHFQGKINTNGGGFASVRSKSVKQLLDRYTIGMRLEYKGDGKTYKLLISQGTGSGGPTSVNPSWQADIPTTDKWRVTDVMFDTLLPNFGGGRRVVANKDDYTFDPTEMNEMGFMLSLKLSNGQVNPPETFGQGIFPFSLQVKSIEMIKKENSSSNNNEL